MALLTHKDEIRAILQRDRAWCLYALGDLSPHMFDKCRWFTPDLSLVLHDYGTSILFAMGGGSVREALDHVTWPVHLQVRPDALAAIERHAVVSAKRRMLRMVWNGTAPPRPAMDVARLTATDVPALVTLYEDGEAAGEAPDFFFPAMVTHGVFCGVFEEDALVAVAGTHLVSRDEGAAAVGNVYTRRDRRGRGLGRAAVAALLCELAGIATIGLNVRVDNEAAIRVYQSLGFEHHCEFIEALATGRTHAPPAL